MTAPRAIGYSNFWPLIGSPRQTIQRAGPANIMHTTHPMLRVIGVSHKTAPVEIREQLAFTSERLASAYDLIKKQDRVPECVILSTCNRFEVYALLQEQQSQDHASLEKALLEWFAEDGAHLGDFAYYHRGSDAARHLFRVTSGIDSLVLGEVQVLGQVQRAWRDAHQADAVGPVLSHLFHKAVALGKRVHSETPISRKPASVSYAAVVLAKQVLGAQLKARRVLVIGTGEVGEGVARCLHEHGLLATVVTHRQVEKAQDVARRYEADIATWEDLPDQLALADVVISSTAAPHTVLQHEHIRDAISRRPGRPLYLIDLAVPRDIDPSAADIPGVHLHNIDDLHAVVHTTLEERRSTLPKINEMVAAEVREYNRWLTARGTFPAIKALREQADTIAERELKWALDKLPNLSPRERDIIQAMTTRITGKMLHGPIQWLKTQAESSIEPDYGMSSLDARQFAGLFLADTSAGKDDTSTTSETGAIDAN